VSNALDLTEHPFLRAGHCEKDYNIPHCCALVETALNHAVTGVTGRKLRVACLHSLAARAKKL
jgi:hypothetical protein